MTAVASAGYQFDHWSGDASGMSTTLTVIMDSEKNIFANFRKIANN
jgi:uncharacterized repeat protein (TIGR02543 family)